MILLPYTELRAKGITLSKCQIWRLEKAGRFPMHVQSSPGRIAWVASEIDAYLAERIAERDARIPCIASAARRTRIAAEATA
jgi:prophage regulatory protein